jgi:hypothetical protein
VSIEVASLPRRRTKSAAGALAAALLLAVQATADAQDAVGERLRGSFGLSDGTQAGGTGAPPADSLKSSEEDIAASSAPLGGIGDEAPVAPPIAPLGGLGDEETEPQPAAPELGITTEAGETSQQLPGINFDSSRHRALPPQRHDLDPYVPIGMRLGSFLLFTEAEIGTILTDNVLATDTDTHSDVAFEVAPDVRLESNWGRHFFSAQFIGDRSWYRDFSVEDDRIYQAILKGRLDVTRRTHLELEAEKSLTQAGRNSISLTDIAGNQIDLNEEHISAAADHTFNRLTLKLTGTVAQYDYDDAPATDPDLFGEEEVPFLDIRDYREDELKLRSSYELSSKTAAFVEGAVNERDYKQPISSAGLRRGSSGYVLLSGMAFELTGRLTGEISAGWGQQQSVEESFSPIEGFLLNGDIIWQPTPATKVEFIARSEIAETTLVDSFGAIDRYYELSLQHAFWRYLVLGTYVSYEIADYVDDPLVDQRLKEGLTAEYYFNPYFSMYGRYEHTDFFSTDEGSDFVENEVRLGVRVRH